MAESTSTEKAKVTISVPEAGKMLGIGRNGAYDAARRGELPTLKFGKRLVVPLAALEKMLAKASAIAA